MKQELKNTDCKIVLSEDKKWVHLIINGKQVVSFHIEYMKKVILEANQDPE